MRLEAVAVAQVLDAAARGVPRFGRLQGVAQAIAGGGRSRRTRRVILGDGLPCQATFLQRSHVV